MPRHTPLAPVMDRNTLRIPQRADRKRVARRTPLLVRWVGLLALLGLLFVALQRM